MHQRILNEITILAQIHIELPVFSVIVNQFFLYQSPHFCFEYALVGDLYS